MSAPSALRFHQQIHVALLGHLYFDDGPEKGGSFHAIPAQYIDYLFSHGLYLLAHGHLL